MNQEIKDILNQRRKLTVIKYVEIVGNVTKACQELGIARSSFYEWKRAYTK